MSTKFFTNADENTLLKKLEGIFQHMQVYHFDALVGYFRASGYFRIQEHLRSVEKVRILVGIDVDMLTNLDVRCNQTPCANNRPRAYRYLASQPSLRMDKCCKGVTASRNSRCNF